MIPQFQDSATERQWAVYFAEVDRVLRFVDKGDALELRENLEGHLAESFSAADISRPESERLSDAIARLGQPTDFLRSLLADGLLDRGTQSFRPLSLLRGLYHSLWLGSARAAVGIGFGVGYLFLAACFAMALMKPFWPSNVGLFQAADGTISFGILSSTAGARELLGWWIMPIAIGVCAILYVTLTKALRAARKRK